MANFKNYSLTLDIAHFSLFLIGNLITFSDVVHKVLVFCFLFIARCEHVHVFTVNKAIGAIHGLKLITSTFQPRMCNVGHGSVTCILWSRTDYPISCHISAFEPLSEVGQSVPVSSFIVFRRFLLNKPNCSSRAACLVHLHHIKKVPSHPLLP